LTDQVLRHLQARLRDALGDTPVVCLEGASRTGKTTLVRALQAELPGASRPRFDDPATLARATVDPAGFLAELQGLTLLDDVDRVPGLLPLLRASVDRGGRFLLSCSGPLPGLAESLGWRMETLTLWPVAQAELQGVHPGLIDACFQGEPDRLRLEPMDRRELLGRVLAGGYLEVQGGSALHRKAWFHGYLDALVQARLRVATDLRDGYQLTRLLASPGADPGPAKRCLDLLEGFHLLAALPSAAGAPYRCFDDAALQAHLLGVAPAALETRPMLAAPLLETFAVMELVKTAPWSQARPALSVLRAGPQLLVVLEDHRRNLVAFAVDASATVQAAAFQGLRDLRGRVGDRLKAGLVLHAGEATRPAGPGLWSAPFQALWAARAGTGG
jgi:hypothetical protein